MNLSSKMLVDVNPVGRGGGNDTHGKHLNTREGEEYIGCDYLYQGRANNGTGVHHWVVGLIWRI